MQRLRLQMYEYYNCCIDNDDDDEEDSFFLFRINSSNPGGHPKGFTKCNNTLCSYDMSTYGLPVGI